VTGVVLLAHSSENEDLVVHGESERNAKTVMGTQIVTAPVAGIPKIGDDPWPSCQNPGQNPEGGRERHDLRITAFKAR